MIQSLEIAKLNAAEAIAELAHFGQKDKQGRPYIEHVRRVAERCQDLTLEQRLATILHDTIEDAPHFVSFIAIRHLFGEAVSDLVRVLTRDSKEFYEFYIMRVIFNPAAIPIKLADLEDNLDTSRDGEMDEDTRQKIESLREKYRKAKARLEARLKEIEDAR